MTAPNPRHPRRLVRLDQALGDADRAILLARRRADGAGLRLVAAVLDDARDLVRDAVEHLADVTAPGAAQR